MARKSYLTCLNFTFRYEGGYVWHKDDPGGPTNFGITQNVLAGWRGKPVSSTDVKNMTRQEAGDIYRANYWVAVRGDDLPAGIDLVVWDYGVNSGPSRAIKALQGALGIKVDGFIGAATLDAAAKANHYEIISAVCRQRQAFVRRLSTYATFGKGWKARIAACLSLARTMVHRSASAPPAIIPDPTPVEEEPAKALATDQSLMTSTTARAGAGAAISGGAIAVKEVTSAISEATGAGKSLGEIAVSVGPWVLLALVVVGFALFILWHKRKQIREGG